MSPKLDFFIKKCRTRLEIYYDKNFDLPNSISCFATDSLRCSESLLSVFLATKRLCNSDIEGGLIKINSGFSVLVFIFLTPSVSISSTHIFPFFCTSSTALLLKCTIIKIKHKTSPISTTIKNT